MLDEAEIGRWHKVAVALSSTRADTLAAGNWLSLPIHPAVRHALAQHSRPRLLIACSGGADSLCVAGLFSSFRTNKSSSSDETDLALAHFNHGWRPDATADAAFVRQFADQHSLPAFFGSAEKPIAKTETASREARLDFLRKAAAEFKADAILFGHHLGDVAESILLRLARGSSADGLCSPRPVTRFASGPAHWRPLLHLEPDVIRDALASVGISWREDSTNTDESHPRNFLRSQILPKVRSLGSHDFVRGCGRTRSLLEEDAEALSTIAREIAKQKGLFEERSLQAERLAQEPHAIQRRILGNWLVQNTGQYPPAAQMAELLNTLNISGSSSEPTSTSRELTRLGAFRLINEDPCWSLETLPDEHPGDAPPQTFSPQEVIRDQSTLLTDGSRIHQTAWQANLPLLSAIRDQPPDPNRECILDLAQVQLPLTARPRQPGDRFCPLGSPGGRKLSDWMIDRKIDRAERERIPVVTDKSGRILWVPGFPPASFAAITASSVKALRLTYHKAESP